ncbi:MAG: PqqD family protein [Actinomycetota bacterium]|nr:PqqD family protein [Actinomycetota bacterium]
MRFRIPEGVVFETIDDEMVLLNLNSGTYFKLNATGHRIWSLIQERGDSDYVIDQMTGTFSVDRAVVERDLEALVNELQAHGLLSIASDGDD